MCIHCLAVFLNNSQILFGCLSTTGITFLETSPFEILRKNLLLKNFSDSELSSSLHLKAFKLFNFVVEPKDHISFFEHLSVVFLDVELSGFLFFFGCGNHHSFVRPVNFKEDSHLFSRAILPLFSVLQPLILIVGIFIVDEVVQDVARVR